MKQVYLCRIVGDAPPKGRVAIGGYVFAVSTEPVVRDEDGNLVKGPDGKVKRHFYAGEPHEMTEEQANQLRKVAEASRYAEYLRVEPLSGSVTTRSSKQIALDKVNAELAQLTIDRMKAKTDDERLELDMQIEEAAKRREKIEKRKD